MARFPRKESDVAALASQMITGLKEHAEEFPAPPRSVEQLEASLSEYRGMLEAAVIASAAASEAYEDKTEALETLVEDMKLVLGYAENTMKNDPTKLKNLGWDGRKDPSSPQPPGQVRALEVKREGPGWIYLDWKRPIEGGVIAAYHVQVGHSELGEWKVVSTCFDTMAVLMGQERGVELYYRVVAVNRTGEGLPSNTVTALL